jgi:hypothetical protein
VYLSPPHIWQLNPHPPPVPVTITKPSSFGRKSFQSAPAARKEPMVTVITLDIQVRKESTDDEILRLTSWARERCLSAVAAPGGGGASSDGYSNGGIDLKTSQGPGGGARRVSSSLLPSQTQQKQVELTVQVMRFEEERALQAEMRHAGHLLDHDHGHGHSHDTGHGHSHDHHDTASNLHEHDHDHGHGPSASHSIHMEPAHTHSHDAPSKSHGHHH